ncbi:MAG TPA: non-heme iron oxygenase ferredoxin subunit [Spirochaetia bacterium]|nr:non-heme iron oxygenase ferredoxin subunit [Spirochaetia bacterium]
MGKWIKIARDEEVCPQLRVELEGHAYALFRLEDGIFALDDICSHEYSRLSEGELFRGQVACPKHGSRFDVKTGKVTGFPATKPVHSYPVRIENGDVYIEVEEEEW